MGALSYKSQTFNDIKNEFISNTGLSKQDKTKLIESEGFTVNDYKLAFNDYKKATEKGEDIRPFKSGVLLGIDSAALRTASGLVGDVGRGFGELASLIAPETVKEIAQKYRDIMPDEAEGHLNELFDPYHGEGIITTGGDFTSGDVEFMARKIGSYLTATNVLKKGITGAVKVSGKEKPESSFNSLKNILTNDELTKTQKLKNFTKEGLWLDAGVTIVDKPSESFVNTIYDSSETSRPYLEAIYANPEDPKALQYAKAAVGNLAIGSAVGGALWGLGTATVAGAHMIKNTKPVQHAIKYSKENLTAYRGLDTNDPSKKAIAEASLTAENNKKALLSKAENNVNTFKQAVKKEEIVKDSKFNPKTEEGLNNLNKALNDPTGPEAIRLAQLYPDTAVALSAMRKDIDNMSSILSKSLGNGKTAGVIENNLDTYLTRTYRVFDDPAYVKDVENALLRYGTPEQKKVGIDLLLAEAEKQLVKQYGISEDNVHEALRAIIKYPNDPSLITQLAKKSETGGNVLSKLKLGKEDQFIKNLWGEYKEPDVNYFKTINKLAESTAQIKYLNEVEDILLKRGAYKDLPGDSALKGISPEAAARVTSPVRTDKIIDPQSSALGTQIGIPENLINLENYAAKRLKTRLGVKEDAVKNPLSGLYVDDPYIAKAIADGFEPNRLDLGDSWVGKLYKGFLYSKALTQASKTAYNPSTHQVNIVGNQFMLSANGLLIESWKNSGKAGKNVIKDLFGGYDLSKASDKELADEFSFLIESGVIGSNVNLGMIRSTFDDIKKNGIDGTFEKIMKAKDQTPKINDAVDAAYAVAGKVAKPLDVAYKTYQAEDDIFKIMFYRATKKQYGEATGLTGKQLDMYAAQLTRDLMPNYNLIPNFFKSVRRLPIGNFLAFPVEMLRTSKNIFKQSYEDYSGKTATRFGITDPVKKEKIKRLGAKRLGGMVSTSAVGSTATIGTASLFGISDEEQKALDKKFASYERGTDKLFLSPINRDSNGHMGVDYVNFGLIDPYQYPKAIFKNAYALTEGAFDKDLTDTDYEKLMISSADQVLGPYFAPSIITDFTLELLGSEPRGVSFAEQKGEAAARTFLPPDLYRYFYKRQQYEDTLTRRNQEDSPYGISKSGYSITKEDAKSMLGIRKKRLDLTANLGRDMRIIKNEKKDSGLGFSKAITDRLINDVDSEEAIYSKYEESVEKDQKAQRNAYATLNDYATLGIKPTGTDFDGENDYAKAMMYKRYKGFSENELGNLYNMLNNTFIPSLDPFSDSNIDRATRSDSPFILNRNLQNKIIEKYKNIYNKKIMERQ